MSAETILSFLSTCSMDQQLNFRIVTQCAPVLKGIKISNLITIHSGMWNQVRKSLKGSSINCFPLYMGKDKTVLFLYRPDQLKRHLTRGEVIDFLQRYGYLDISLSGVLIRMKQRYQKYIDQRTAFPHELGVMLEYPTEDVEGFIENQGKNCLLEKYWKVYHNKEQAEKIFQLYDQAKKEAMEEVVAGYPLYKVAVS